MSIIRAIRETLRSFHESTGQTIGGIRLDKETFGALVVEIGTRHLVTAPGPHATYIIDGYCEVWCEDDD